MSSKKKIFTDLATLLDKTNEDLERLSTIGKRSKATSEAIQKLLEADLNSISCTNLKNKKLPYGVIFDFKDKYPEEGQPECYSLLASGHDRKWILIDEFGNTTEGEVKIDKNEIWFRHKDPSITDIIEPKTKAVIENIRGFKDETKLQSDLYVRHNFGGDNLDKAKRAAHFDANRDNAFLGYFNINTKKICYDIESTLYTITWSALSSKDVRKDRLKFESDLIYDDYKVGDQVIDSKDTSDSVDIGYIESIKAVKGQTTTYIIKYKNEERTWDTEVMEDSLALWTKAKYVDTDAPGKLETLNVKIEMLEQNNSKRTESNATSRALQKVAEKENKIFHLSNENAEEQKFTARESDNEIVSEIDSEEDGPEFFADLDSKTKKALLQFVVSAFQHYKGLGLDFIKDVETTFGFLEPQIEALIQWMDRNVLKVKEIVDDKNSKCSACSSAIKSFDDVQQLIEFDRQYLNGWSCDECGKDSREEGGLFPMNHCIECKQDKCKFCIPSLECFPWYSNRATEGKFCQTMMDSKTIDNDCKNYGVQKRKREKSTEKLEEEKTSEDEKQKRKM